MTARTEIPIAVAGEIPPPIATLSAMAREALDDADNDVAKASEALKARLLTRPEVLDRIITEVVSVAVSTRVGGAMRSERRAIILGSMRQIGGGGRDAVRALSAVVGRSILDFPLAGGVRLRDATREQVIEQAALYERFAADQAHKARWLNAIAADVPPGAVVGTAITEARAAALLEETNQ